MNLIISIVLMCLGFVVVYHTSNRLQFTSTTFRVWACNHRIISKLIGSVLMLLSFYTMTLDYGWGAGIFMGLIYLTIVASLIILFYPVLFNHHFNNNHARK